MKLNYQFAKYVITRFQQSGAEYVKPFLKPVDPETDEASDYYAIIKHPMDLATMFQELEDGKYLQVSDVERSFERMFDNCFDCHLAGSQVYQRGQDFKRAFRKIWAGKDDWIKEHPSTDDSGERLLRDTSYGDQMEDTSGSDGDTQESDETSEDDLSPRRRRYVPYQDVLTDDDTSEDGRVKVTNNSEDKTSQNDTSEGYSPPVTRWKHKIGDARAYGLTYMEPERRCRARKKDGSKRHLSMLNSASDLNANHKRSLDTTAGLDQRSLNVQDEAMSNEQLTEADKSSLIEQQAVPTNRLTEKPRLELIFHDHFQDSLQVLTQQTQTQQPQTEQPETRQSFAPEQQTHKPPEQEQQTQQPPVHESQTKHPIQQPYQPPNQEEMYCICLTPAFPPPLTASHQTCRYNSCLDSRPNSST
jgi:hypothetical protein